LRHQLNVLRQRAPHRLHLRWADRALFILAVYIKNLGRSSDGDRPEPRVG